MRKAFDKGIRKAMGNDYINNMRTGQGADQELRDQEAAMFKQQAEDAIKGE